MSTIASNKVSWISKVGMAVVGLALSLGIQACEEKRATEQPPAKALESTAPPAAAEKSAPERRESSPGGESVPDTSREGAPTGSAK